MLKLTAVALAAVLSTTAVVPSVAMAGDHGPCDHCTMEPIVVKGERPEKENDTAETANHKFQVVQPTPDKQLQIPTLGTPTVPAAETRN